MYKDSEEENYRAKYGLIESSDVHFDDHPDLGPEYLQYKIEKIKFWKSLKGSKTIIVGIQTFYKNNRTGEEIISEENKGTDVKESNEEEVLFNLSPNEYITRCSLWMNGGMIFKIKFNTNLKNEFSVGENHDEEIIVSELNNTRNKFVLSFFGTFGKNNLTSIGLFINKQNEFFDYFVKGYFQLKLYLNKKDNLSNIEEGIKNNKYNYVDTILVKACQLPKLIFHQIIKYISFV